MMIMLARDSSDVKNNAQKHKIDDRSPETPRTSVMAAITHARDETETKNPMSMALSTEPAMMAKK